MLAEGRDLLALMFMEKRLGALREQYMELTIEGNQPGAGFWEVGEENIRKQMFDRFYGNEVANLVGSAAEAGSDVQKDFEEGARKTSEQAVEMSHRALVRIPFVGQPGFGDS